MLVPPAGRPTQWMIPTMQTATTNIAAAPEAHPYAFHHLQEARDALRQHVGKLGDRELTDIRNRPARRRVPALLKGARP